jgi:hypothetical protein
MMLDGLQQMLPLDRSRGYDHRRAVALREESLERHYHHRNGCHGRLPDLLRPELPAVHGRCPEVEEDHTEDRRGAKVNERLLAVRRSRDDVAFAFEGGGHRFSRVNVVLDEQDASDPTLHNADSSKLRHGSD